MFKLSEWYAKSEKWVLVTLLIFYLFFSALYPTFNHPQKYTFYFGTFIDELIPFLPVGIVFYAVWYFFLPTVGVIALLKDRKVLLKGLLSFNIGIAICFLLYSLFQTTVPRPEVPGTDIFSTIVRMIYANDQPYNCFPSIHVLTSYLCILMVTELKNLKKPVVIGFVIVGWLINISTLVVKQHVVADLIAGVVLGWLVYKVVGKFIDKLYAHKASIEQA